MEAIDLSCYKLTIGEMAARDCKSAELFRKFGIDYCCHGDKTLAEACTAAGISEEVFDVYYEKPARSVDDAIYEFWRWDTAFLVDYIVNTHHHCTKQLAKTIPSLAHQAAARQGNANPVLNELAERTEYFLNRLEEQMEKEETVLFPLIKKLLTARGKNYCAATAAEMVPAVLCLKTEMEEENRSAGDDLKFITCLISKYNLPHDADELYTSLFMELSNLENDLVQHVHLESNILYQKAAALCDEAITGHR